MDGFPLFTLFPTLLEKTISKCKPESFFCLRQTCRDANDFIENSRNISIFLEDYTSFHWDENSNSWVFYSSNHFHDINVESLYGTRLGTIKAPDRSEGFQYFCDQLKKCRVTAIKVVIYSSSEIPKEQYRRLFKVLNPKKIYLSSEQINQFETLFHLKNLESVEIQLKNEDVATVAVHLIPRCQELTILTELPYSDKSSFLRTILQILLNNYWPNLRIFDFRILYEKLWPSEDEFEKLFGGLGLSIEEDEEGACINYQVIAETMLPAHFPRESSCTVVVQDYRDGLQASIYYREGEDALESMIDPWLHWNLPNPLGERKGNTV